MEILAKMYDILSDKNRLRFLKLLKHKPRFVCDIQPEAILR